MRPRRFKLRTHMDSGQMYRVYRNQAVAAYLSLYFFIFLSSFQTLKVFVTLFSRTVRPTKLKLGTHVDSRQIYPVYWCTGLPCPPVSCPRGQDITWYLVPGDTLPRGRISSSPPRLILSSGTRYRRYGILFPGTFYPGVKCPPNPIHLSFNIIWWVNSPHPYP